MLSKKFHNANFKPVQKKMQLHTSNICIIDLEGRNVKVSWVWSLSGELKKLLAAETGLQAGDQILIFRGKERENREYLDICGVKDRSKVTLIEDPSSKERRFIEMRRNAKIQTAQRAVTDVSMEIDKLAEQVIKIPL